MQCHGHQRVGLAPSAPTDLEEVAESMVYRIHEVKEPRNEAGMAAESDKSRCCTVSFTPLLSASISL